MKIFTLILATLTFFSGLAEEQDDYRFFKISETETTYEFGLQVNGIVHENRMYISKSGFSNIQEAQTYCSQFDETTVMPIDYIGMFQSVLDAHPNEIITRALRPIDRVIFVAWLSYEITGEEPPDDEPDMGADIFIYSEHDFIDDDECELGCERSELPDSEWRTGPYKLTDINEKLIRLGKTPAAPQAICWKE